MLKYMIIKQLLAMSERAVYIKYTKRLSSILDNIFSSEGSKSSNSGLKEPTLFYPL